MEPSPALEHFATLRQPLALQQEVRALSKARALRAPAIHLTKCLLLVSGVYDKPTKLAWTLGYISAASLSLRPWRATPKLLCTRLGRMRPPYSALGWQPRPGSRSSLSCVGPCDDIEAELQSLASADALRQAAQAWQHQARADALPVQCAAQDTLRWPILSAWRWLVVLPGREPLLSVDVDGSSVTGIGRTQRSSPSTTAAFYP